MKAGRGLTYRAVGAFATQNGTWGAFGGDASRWFDGRLRTLVGAGAGQFNLDFYGLGSETSSLNQGVRYSLQFAGAVAQANWQLAPKSPWAVGVRYVYANVDPKPRESATSQGLADRVRVTISAPTAIVEFDTRDNVFTPTRGVYAESSWLASREALGASDDFERFQQVLIGWHPLAHRRDARSARELCVVIGRHAFLPQALRATARSGRDALSG